MDLRSAGEGLCPDGGDLTMIAFARTFDNAPSYQDVCARPPFFRPPCAASSWRVWARQWIRGRELLLRAERDRHGIVIPPAAMAVRSVSYSGLVFVETSKI